MVAFIQLYPKLIPEAAVSFDMNREDALAASHKYLAEWGYTPDEFQYMISLCRSDDLIRYYESTYGLVKGNEHLSGIPALYWWIEYAKIKDKAQRYVVSANAVRGFEQPDVSIKMDVRGNLVELQRQLPDTVAGGRLTEGEARGIALSALAKHISLADWQFEGSSITHLRSRTDYRFSWSKANSTDSLRRRAEVTVQGDKLGALTLDYQVPRLEKTDSVQSVAKVASGVVLFILIITAVVFLFLRTRSNEVDFKSGIIWGALTAVGVIVMLVSQSLAGSQRDSWSLILSALVGGVFLGALVWVAWMTSDSVGREVWNEKFYTIGRIKKGRFISETIGTALLRGIASGVLLLGLAVTVCYIVDHWAYLCFGSSGSSSSGTLPLGYSAPAVFFVGNIVLELVFVQTVVVLFAASLIKKYLKHIAAVVCVGGLLFSVHGLSLFEN